MGTAARFIRNAKRVLQERLPGISGTAHPSRLAKSHRVGRVAVDLNFLSLCKRILTAPAAHPSFEFSWGIAILDLRIPNLTMDLPATIDPISRCD